MRAVATLGFVVAKVAINNNGVMAWTVDTWVTTQTSWLAALEPGMKAMVGTLLIIYLC